ncbi:MAG: Hsp20 family protein [Alphaproteobacteria bacterium]|jgi:molecular chaperone IbpA|nr:Hsp20 family protein [Alphaproteobacteria bacterium]MDP6817279.1 Hsp20 family protein [Alphaproteobacteria bacterium]|tara:strand:- start:103 stop:561 length:459 start_codon:yes stop_codon:yes gene_type:complete
MRTAYDFSPLFRTAVGFDRITRMLNNSAQYADGDLSYPPYDIEQKGEDHYRVTMAVAGFGPEDVDVVVHENTLTVSGRARAESENGGKDLLYQGIAKRAFERRFQLADYIKVENAGLEDGLLTIDLARQVPEEKKPRRIEIHGAAKLENKAA